MSDNQVQHKLIQNLSKWRVPHIQNMLVRTLQTLKCRINIILLFDTYNMNFYFIF
jgi:hypothetical protein